MPAAAAGARRTERGDRAARDKMAADPSRRSMPLVVAVETMTTGVYTRWRHVVYTVTSCCTNGYGPLCGRVRHTVYSVHFTLCYVKLCTLWCHVVHTVHTAILQHCAHGYVTLSTRLRHRVHTVMLLCTHGYVTHGLSHYTLGYVTTYIRAPHILHMVTSCCIHCYVTLYTGLRVTLSTWLCHVIQ